MANQKKGMDKLSIVIVLVVLIGIAIYIGALLRKQAPFGQIPENKEAIKIGFIGDFSNDKVRSENALAAAKIAIKDINKIYDKKYEIVVYNVNKNNQKDIGNAFKSGNNDNVMAILNLVNPKGYATYERLPSIYVGGTKRENTTREKFYWNIRLFFIKSDYVGQHISLIKPKYNISSAAFVVDNNEQLSEDFIKNLKALNEIKTTNYVYDSSKLSDITKDIKIKNPDIVLLLTNTQNTIQFLKTAKENGLDNKLFLAFLPTTKDLLLEEKNLPKRLIIVAPPVDILGNNSPPKDNFGEFVSKFSSLTRHSVTNLELNAYDATSLITYAVSKSNITNDPESIQENRDKVIKELWNTVKFKSLRGTLTADGKTGTFKRDYIRTFYIENGRFKSAINQTI